MGQFYQLLLPISPLLPLPLLEPLLGVVMVVLVVQVTWQDGMMVGAVINMGYIRS